MKRPLAVIGYTYLAALTVALFLGEGCAGWLGCVLLIGFAISMKSKRLRCITAIPVAFLTAMIAILMLSLYTAFLVKPSIVFQGQTATAEAELCELPYQQYERYYYPLNALELKTDDGTVLANTKILVSSSKELHIDAFDRLSGRIHFSSSISNYQSAKGFRLTGYLTDPENITVTATADKPPFYYALALRRYLSGVFYDILPVKQASFITGMLLGDKTGIDSSVQENLQAAGLSHIIVVSGVHLSILTGLCLFVVLRISRHKKFSILICFLFVFTYMAVTGFSTSVVRAGIMQLLVLTGLLLRRQAEPFNSLGLSVLVLTVPNPYAAMDISLLLSFSATFGILFAANKMANYALSYTTVLPPLLYPQKRSRVESVVRAFFNLLSVSLSAFLFTIPVTVLYFHRISLYAILSNMAVSALIPLLLTTAVLLLLLHGGVILSSIVIFLTDYIIAVSEQVAHWPYSVLQLSQRFIPWWLLGVTLLAVILLLCKAKRYRNRIFILGSVLSLVLGVTLTDLLNENVVRIAVLDTGNGASVLLLQHNHAAVLSCGGDYNRYSAIKSYLDGTQTQTLSLLLLTNRQWAFSAYAERLLTDYPTETVLLYDQKRWPLSIQQLSRNAESCVSCDSQKIPLQQIVYDDMTIFCYEDKTHHAVYTDINGYRILLLTEEADAALLPVEWRECDLLILHGLIENKTLLSYDTVIIADKNENFRKYLSLKDKENVYRTYDEQHIIVRLQPDHQTEIRREHLWLS